MKIAVVSETRGRMDGLRALLERLGPADLPLCPGDTGVGRAERRSGWSSGAAVSLLAAILLFPAHAAAQGGAPGDAAAPADSVHRAVDRVFREFDRRDSPGCALGVMRDGDLAYARGYGTADLEQGRPITPSTRFYAASVSKQFTAASVLLAERAGALSGEDPVRRHVPELPSYGDTIRVRHLAHHTSGIRDIYGLMDLAGLGLESATAEEVVDLVARQEALNFSPGEEHLYSNSGYLLMAEIVERATGRSLRQYAAERLFGPLGMDDTHFHDDALHFIPGKAVGYEADDDGEGVERAYLPGFTGVGPGGMWTTVRDLAEWNRNFTERAVGGPEFPERLKERAVLRRGDTLEYAWGIELSEHKGIPTVGHGGSFMGYRTHFVRAPEQRLGVALLCNQRRIDPGDLSRQVMEIYLEDEIRTRLREFAGRYRGPEVGATWALVVDGADLVAKGPDGERRVLEYEARDTFGMGGAELRFTRESGRVIGFTYEGGRVRGVGFEKVAGSP